MRALIQRVSKGSVSVDGKIIGEIGNGMVILFGVKNGDTEADIPYLANKCANLRIFNDENGNLNRSLLEVNGAALVISQFTLYGDTRKGRRPGFSTAANPEIANALYEKFVKELQHLGIHCETGIFGAMMQVNILNEGPVTLMVESKSG